MLLIEIVVFSSHSIGKITFTVVSFEIARALRLSLVEYVARVALQIVEVLSGQADQTYRRFLTDFVPTTVRVPVACLVHCCSCCN